MFETKVQFSLDREIENKPFSWNEIFFGAKLNRSAMISRLNAGKTNWKGRSCTVDRLIKVPSFVK